MFMVERTVDVYSLETASLSLKGLVKCKVKTTDESLESKALTSLKSKQLNGNCRKVFSSILRMFYWKRRLQKEEGQMKIDVAREGSRKVVRVNV